jgi:serine phosphatase RsbU (regulator of sigma subunit)/NO-binding membrane sensor protein with MHYT domain
MLSSSYNTIFVLFSLCVVILVVYTASDLNVRIAMLPRRAVQSRLAASFYPMVPGIWGMYLIGMLALRLRLELEHDLALTLLSLVMAISASAFALELTCQRALSWRRLLGGALLMGGAIVGVQYDGVAAAVEMVDTVCQATAHGINADWQAFLVIIVTLAVVATALIISVFNVRLESTTQEKTRAYQKINDSIAYASLIQRSLLPNRLLHSTPGINCAVLWLPRDVVGGDFYICHASAHGCLIGVMDCAGHGVPGALMTMLVHSVIDQTITQVGAENPAALLMRLDLVVRKMLGKEAQSQLLATNIDIGLAYLDFNEDMLTFAGAKIDLYCEHGAEVLQLRGARRAIGGRHVIEYSNVCMALDGATFYLTTDGFLDQAGGEKAYGFGNHRFKEAIQRHAALPLAQKAAAFKTTLGAYQGRHAQRDDITMLCFRFDASKRAS